MLDLKGYSEVGTIFPYFWLVSNDRKGCEDAKYFLSNIPHPFSWVLKGSCVCVCVCVGDVGWGEAWLDSVFQIPVSSFSQC